MWTYPCDNKKEEGLAFLLFYYSYSIVVTQTGLPMSVAELASVISTITKSPMR